MPRILAVILELFVLICVLWATSILSIFWHEFGHACGYMLSTGGGRWQIRVGSGKKLVDTKILTVKFLPFDGYFDPRENRIDKKAKLVSTLSGGPAASFILVAALLLLKFGGVSFDSGILASDATEFLVNYALIYNAFVFLLSVIPAHYSSGENRGMETDGLKILNAIKNRKKP